MKTFEILIPVSPNSDENHTFTVGVGYNAGKEKFQFLSEYHKAFETFALGLVGGMSKFTEIDGVWIDEEKVYREKMIPYRFACTDEQISAIAEYAKGHYYQKSIFVLEIGTATFF